MVAVAHQQSGDIPIGTPVYSADGHKIGTLRGADLFDMIVEDGFIFVREMIFPLSEADRYEDGRLILRHTKEDLIAASK